VRISGVERGERGGRVRLRARLVWEEAERPPEELWLETAREHAEELAPLDETFLLAAFVPAMERGERRVRVEGTLCPLLARGVRAASRTLRQWFPRFALPEVEAAAGLRPLPRATPPRVAATFSGGVDSLATIRANRLALPVDHAGAIRDAFFVFGMNTYDFSDGLPDPGRVRDYEERLRRWLPLAEEARLRVVPVTASFRLLAPSFESWARGTISAALAGIAHAFSPRLTGLLVPSAGGTDLLAPEGTHPMLDPFYSSTALQVSHDGQWMSRLEKLRLVADWEPALAILQPCQQHQIGRTGINCGACNKCHRTMLELEALGRLAGAVSFPRRELDARFVEEMEIARGFDVECHAECIPLLRARGREDLAAALERRLRSWRDRSRPTRLRRLRALVRGRSRRRR
jgi:hypothetical protein